MKSWKALTVWGPCQSLLSPVCIYICNIRKVDHSHKVIETLGDPVQSMLRETSCVPLVWGFCKNAIRLIVGSLVMSFVGRIKVKQACFWNQKKGFETNIKKSFVYKKNIEYRYFFWLPILEPLHACGAALSWPPNHTNFQKFAIFTLAIDVQ